MDMLSHSNLPARRLVVFERPTPSFRLSLADWITQEPDSGIVPARDPNLFQGRASLEDAIRHDYALTRIMAAAYEWKGGA